MMLKNITLNKNVAMTLLKTQKHSPTILFGAGVVGVVGTVVLASRATLKVGDILDETNANLAKIASVEDHPEYSDQDRTKDKAIVYTQTALKIGKIYMPAVAIGIISIGCLTGSHHILSRRNVALSAAYAGLEKTFKEYRGRVIESIGEEKEARIWQPMEKVDAIDESGKKVKVEVQSSVGGSPYRVIFDEFNKNWNTQTEYNQFFIQAQQNYANDKLRANGHLFLNDVHDMLGLERTKAGQIVGWMWNSEMGDNYVSFGVFDDNLAGMRFVTGEEPSIWLDFNVDGNILDHI